MTQVRCPIFVNYFSQFASEYNSVLYDDSCLLTITNNSSKCSVNKNTILSAIEDASITESFNVRILDYRSSSNKSITWFLYDISINNNASIKYERMSLEGGTAEGLVDLSYLKISVELENGKV